MSKGRRIREERIAGTRKPNGTHWNEIKCGMILIIPTFKRTQRGGNPFMLPIPPERRFSNIDRNIAVEKSLVGIMKPQVSGYPKGLTAE